MSLTNYKTFVGYVTDMSQAVIASLSDLQSREAQQAILSAVKSQKMTRASIEKLAGTRLPLALQGGGSYDALTILQTAYETGGSDMVMQVSKAVAVLMFAAFSKIANSTAGLWTSIRARIEDGVRRTAGMKALRGSIAEYVLIQCIFFVMLGNVMYAFFRGANFYGMLSRAQSNIVQGVSNIPQYQSSGITVEILEGGANNGRYRRFLNAAMIYYITNLAVLGVVAAAVPPVLREAPNENIRTAIVYVTGLFLVFFFAVFVKVTVDILKRGRDYVLGYVDDEEDMAYARAQMRAAFQYKLGPEEDDYD